MSQELNPTKALIFRIVHRDNMPWIIENGLHARNGKPCPDYRNIGNVDLIDKRSKRQVEVGPKGTLNDYVPFYFTPFSIMLYNIHTGYGGIRQVPNDEIVILVSSLHQIHKMGLNYVFTNQHAYPVMAEYFTDLARLDRIDWALLQSRNFKHDPDDPGKKERYQAEALVWKHVPLEALSGICCHSKGVEQKIQAELLKRKVQLTTIVKPGWYF